MCDKVNYFLFGSEACQELLNEGEEAFLKWTEDNTDYDIYMFVWSKSSPIDLLNQFEGWGEYSVISRELYESLNK